MAKSVVRLWNTNEIKALVHNGIKEGTKRCAEHLLQASQELVPVDTSRLKESGFVDETPSGFMVRYYADSHSDSNFDYAIIQHEEIFHHPKGGRDHYLQIPAEQYREMYASWIAEAVDKKL